MKSNGNNPENQNEESGTLLPMEPVKRRVRLNPGGIVTLALIVAIIAVSAFIVKDIIKKKNAEPTFVITDADGTNQSVQVTPTPVPQLRPTAEEGYLPVFFSANTAEKEVAVTISGRLNQSQMDKLTQTAAETGARLTFVPTGKALESSPAMWQEVYLMGHEIESGGYDDTRYLAMDSAQQRGEAIDKAIRALKDCIHPDYELHFLRTNDMYDMDYLELHRLLSQRGVYGIASQSVNLSKQTTPDEIQPGVIINLEIGTYTVDELCSFIKWLSEQGYSAVTMNELFDYGPNYASTPETE